MVDLTRDQDGCLHARLFPSCPIPEVAWLGRTLRAWGQPVLAYFATAGVSNGGAEAINLIVEKVRRVAEGVRDFDHYRLHILLAASAKRAYRTRPTQVRRARLGLTSPLVAGGT